MSSNPGLGRAYSDSENRPTSNWAVLKKNNMRYIPRHGQENNNNVPP